MEGGFVGGGGKGVCTGGVGGEGFVGTFWTLLFSCCCDSRRWRAETVAWRSVVRGVRGQFAVGWKCVPVWSF